MASRCRAALLINSGLCDLTKTGDSYYTNEGVDNRISSYDGFLESLCRLMRETAICAILAFPCLR